MYFNQGNAACFAFGVFFLGVGMMIALEPFAYEIKFKDTPTYDEKRNFLISYLFGTGIVLLLTVVFSYSLFPN